MRLASCLLLAMLGLLAGCTTPARRPAADARPGTAAAPTPRPSPDNADPLVSQAAVQEHYGILAGHVLDLGTGRPVDAYVRWECLDDAKEESGEVAATGGYFTIQGRKAGKQYKLTARAKRGERLLAGVSFVTAPNVNIFIKMSEAFVTPATPPLPGPPVPGDKPAETPKDKKTGSREPAWQPGAIGAPPPATRAAPAPAAGPLPAAPAMPPAYPPGLANDLGRPRTEIPAEVPGPKPRPWEAPGSAPGPVPTGPALPPSCNLMGNQVGGRLYNLALPDLEGHTWEWRKDRRGKVVLLDFWSSHCLPCLASIENLKQLQAQYGPIGLEVIGIACESQGTPQEQALRVALACRARQTNYRLLLASGLHNPVPEQFGVRSVPTLFLLDEQGTILWIHEGLLTPPDLLVLRRLIERALGMSP